MQLTAFKVKMNLTFFATLQYNDAAITVLWVQCTTQHNTMLVWTDLYTLFHQSLLVMYAMHVRHLCTSNSLKNKIEFISKYYRLLQEPLEKLSMFVLIWTNVHGNNRLNFGNMFKKDENDSSSALNGITGRGSECPLRHFSPGNFCWPTGKNRARKKGKKGKMGRKEGKFERKEVKIWKWKGKRYENEQRTFFFFPPHFLKSPKFVWGLPEWTIFTGKNHISRRQKIGKTEFAPSEKYSSFAPVCSQHHEG